MPDRAMFFQSTAASTIPSAVEQLSSDVHDRLEPDELNEGSTAMSIPDSAWHLSTVAPAPTQALSSPDARLTAPDMMDVPVETQIPSREQALLPSAPYYSTHPDVFASAVSYDWNFLETDIDLTGVFPQLSGMVSPPPNRGAYD